jgi:8-oxo-dGTP pyrophosphatase MutT (NUDIX family)
MPRYRQSGVIAFRGPPESMEVVLVESSSKKRWVIPKGLVEPDLAPGESAAKEAYEEAGIRGELSKAPVGSYEYRKWGVRLQVEVFLLRVTAVLDRSPEGRRRRWLSPPRAAAEVKHPELKRLLAAAPQLVAAASWLTDSLIPTFG